MMRNDGKKCKKDFYFLYVNLFKIRIVLEIFGKVLFEFVILFSFDTFRVSDFLWFCWFLLGMVSEMADFWQKDFFMDSV